MSDSPDFILPGAADQKQQKADTSFIAPSDADNAAISALQLARTITPEQAADDISTAGLTGIPRDVVSRNRAHAQSISASIKAQSDAEYLKSHPALNDWLSDPDNAAIGSQDIKTLAQIEQQTRAYNDQTSAWDTIKRSAKQGWLGAKQMVSGLKWMPAIKQGAEAELTGDVEIGTDPFGQPIMLSHSLTDSQLSKMIELKKNVGKAAAGELAKESAAIQGEQQKIPQRPATQAMMMAKTAGDAFDAFMVDPVGVMADIGISSTIQQAPALALTIATRNPAVAAMVAGGNSYYAEMGSGVIDYLSNNGVDTTKTEEIQSALSDPSVSAKAIRYAETRAGVVGAFDTASGGLAGRMFAPSKIVTSKIARELTNDLILQPVVQAGLGAAGEAGGQFATTGKIGSPGQVLAEAAGEFSSAPVEVSGFAFDRLREKAASAIDDKKKATAEKEIVDSIVNLADETKTKGLAPDRLEKLIAKLKGKHIDNVYVPVADAAKFYQSKGVDPNERIKQLTGDEDAYFEASMTGGTVAIPMERYASNVTPEEHAEFTKVLRLKDNAAPANEAISQSDQIEKMTGEIIRSSESRPADDKSNVVFDDVSQQLQSAGTDRATAEQYAAQVQAAIRTLATRENIDPGELYKSLNFGVKSTVPESLQKAIDLLAAKKDVNTAVDPILDAIRSGKVPSDESVYGKSFIDALIKAGGINDVGGELTSRDVGKAKPGLINKNGMSLDDAVLWAYENGYIDKPPTSELGKFDANAPDSSTVLDLIDKELGGNKVYSSKALNKNKAAFKDAMQAFQEGLDARGIDISKLSNEEARFALGIANQKGNALGNAIILQQSNSRGNGLDRGEISISQDKIAISLFQARDLSTFLHESGHLYLELMRRLNERQEASSGLRDDMASIKNWWEDNAAHIIELMDDGLREQVNNRGGEEYVKQIADNWSKPQVDATGNDVVVELHEYFARGYEAYLREGKAPSNALRDAFARFTEWLLSIYRSVKNLNVNMTPEIRGVMDRILATDEEIRLARASQHFDGLFTEASALGMSDSEFAAYKEAERLARAEALSSEAAQQYQIEKRAEASWWKSERAKVEKEIAEQVNSMPIYQMIANMRKGEQADGSPLAEGVQQIKLDSAEVYEKYGSAFAGKHLAFMTAKEGGVPLSVAADVFGYSSGDEMIQAIAEAKPKAELIKAGADAEMNSRHPDPMLDGNIAQRAMNAVHNEKQAQLMAKEIQLLERKAGGNNPQSVLDMIKRKAKTIISSKKVADIRPGQYQLAEAKAGKAALLAASRNDFNTALQERTRQLLNHELYKAAIAAQEESEKIQTYAKSLLKNSAQQRIGKAGQELLKQMNAILAAYDFTYMPGYKLGMRKSLSDMARRLEADGVDVVFSPETMALIESGKTRNWKETSLDELRGVRDSLKNIETIARQQNSIRIQGEQIALDEARSNFSNAVQSAFTVRGPAPVDMQLRRTWIESKKSAGRSFRARMTRLESFADMIDGDGNINGFMNKYFVRPLAESRTAELDMLNSYTSKLLDMLDEHSNKVGGLGDTVYIKSLRQNMTRGGVIAVALNMGNESNRQRVIDGRRWYNGEVEEILSQLTEADAKFVQDTWDLLESLWPMIEEQQQRLTGVAPPKIDRLPFVINTKDGKSVPMKGGYFPIQYDKASAEYKAFVNSSMHDDSMFGPERLLTLPLNGYTKARVEKASMPIVFDLQIIPQHITSVIKDVTHREALLDMRKILRGRDVVNAFNDGVGYEFLEMIDAKLKEIATGQQFTATGLIKDNYKIWSAIRKRVTVMGLGLSMLSGIKQSIGLFNSQEVLSADLNSARKAASYLLRGYGDLFNHWNDAISNVAEVSGEMRHHLDTANVDVRNAMDEYLAARTKGGILGKATRIDAAIRAHAFILIKYIQAYLVDVPTWHAANRSALDRGMSPADAVAYADGVVRRSQGSGNPWSTSLIEGDKGPMQLFTLFYSYASVYANRQMTIMHRANKARREGGKARVMAEMPLLAARFALLGILPVIAEELFNMSAGAGGAGDDDKDGQIDAEELAHYLAMKSLAYQFYGIPLVKDVAQYATGTAKGEYRLSPIQAPIEAYMKVAHDVSRLNNGDDVEPRRLARDAVNTAGYTLGLPTAGPWKNVDYLWRLADEEEQPESLPELAWAIAIGKRAQN